MRILQVVFPGASPYELKGQRIDRAALEARGHAVTNADTLAGAADAGVVHVYGPTPLSRARLRGIATPYLANARPAPARWPLFGRVREPAVVISPLQADGVQVVPEAVEDLWFDAPRGPRTAGDPRVAGSFVGERPWARAMAEQTTMRIRRFREDVEWRLFDEPPSPEDLAGVDVWVDPARDDQDLDGFVAEALVGGTPVVAARTAVNEVRSDKGRTALLVPPGDSNELTHAILAALFKPEVAQQKVQAARLTASKFRSSQRLRALIPIYETLTR